MPLKIRNCSVPHTSLTFVSFFLLQEFGFMKYASLLLPVVLGTFSVLGTPMASQAMQVVHPAANNIPTDQAHVFPVQLTPPPGERRYDPYAADAPSIGGGAVPGPSGPAIGGGATPSAPRQRHPGRNWSPFSPADNITCYPRERACYNRRGYYMPSWTRRVFSKWL